MRKYFNYYVKKVVTVKNLVTLEHLILSPNFTYPNEVHSFHEFAFVDSGEIVCHTKQERISLKQGDLFFISPGTSHHYEMSDEHAATIFIACFSCRSDFLELLDGVCTLDKKGKRLIADIVCESKNAFQYPFNKKLELLEKPMLGAQQLIENRIEELLIQLIRERINAATDIRFVMNSTELENELINDIILILKENLYSRITLDTISSKTFYSKTYINTIFKKNIGESIMHYYNRLKVEEAKKLFRKNLSTSIVAERLDFESPNYFTKVFKRYTYMTPSQYKKTILD